VKGILKLAYKLLVNDRAKFTALLVGISFAVFLMTQMMSMFAGVLHRASSTVINIGATVWVMDRSVQTVANTIGMPDYTLDAVRSMQGARAAPPMILMNSRRSVRLAICAPPTESSRISRHPSS
jgi:putative ABC transport system permease protein